MIPFGLLLAVGSSLFASVTLAALPPDATRKYSPNRGIDKYRGDPMHFIWIGGARKTTPSQKGSQLLIYPTQVTHS